MLKSRLHVIILRFAYIIIILVFCSFGLQGAGAQESCGNLQNQLGVLRSSGGAGSEWDAFIQQRMQQLGCFGGQQQAPRTYTQPRPRDLEAERRAEELRQARQRALAEEAQRKHEADIQRAQNERDAQVRRRADELRLARERDEALLQGQPSRKPLLSAPVNGSDLLLGAFKNSSTLTQSGWSTPTPPTPQQVQANQKYFESVMADPNQPMVSRKLAAAVLGKSLPDLPNAAPQVTQAERELAAIAYGKQLPVTSSQPMPMDDQLRIIMNNPKESPANRQIAAIGLGIDPATLGLSAGSGVRGVTPQPALQLNPNLKTDIATLKPPAVKEAIQTVPAQNQWIGSTSTFAPPTNSQNISVIDSKMAKQALPYALMSRDVYNDAGGNVGTTQWKRTENWDVLLKQNGASQTTIDKIRDSGFYAAIYQNQKTGEVSIAFRGTDTKNPVAFAKDLATSAGANAGFLPIQYEAASSLTAIVKSQAGPNQSITLTGHSLGGALASYAANDNRIKAVITFNPARGYMSDGFVNNPSQLNIFTKGEIIGDPSKSGVLGAGRLSGLSVGADSKAVNRNLLNDLEDVHSIKNIVDTLADKASEN